MTVFQWKQSDIDWFILKFKNEEREIDARSVQRKYNNSPTASDFRQLMRLVVKSGYARVTSGCVESKRYRIRMISEKCPYQIDLFDKELIEHPELNNMIPEFEELIDIYFPGWEGYNLYQLEEWDRHQSFMEIIIAGFSVYNFQGGDYDSIWESEVAKDFTDSHNYKDFFSLVMNTLVAEYTAFKIMIPEVRSIAAKMTGDVIPEINPSCIFVATTSSVVTLSVLKHMEELIFPFHHRASDRYVSNIIKGLINSDMQGISLTGGVIPKMFMPHFFDDPRCHKYIDLVESATQITTIGGTEGLSPEALNAYENVKKTYRQAVLFAAGSLLTA